MWEWIKLETRAKRKDNSTRVPNTRVQLLEDSRMRSPFLKWHFLELATLDDRPKWARPILFSCSGIGLCALPKKYDVHAFHHFRTKKSSTWRVIRRE